MVVCLLNYDISVVFLTGTKYTKKETNMHIILAGQGKMAAAMEIACFSRGIGITKFGTDFDYSKLKNNKLVAVHFGSGKQLLSLIELCERFQIPLIQGSTNVNIPNNRRTIIVNAPNLSLPMIRFLEAFPAFASAIKIGMSISIIESHQKQKTDVSGTARVLAKTIGTKDSIITTIRDPDIQLSLGIPKEHLGGHAYHDFIFTGHGVEIKVSTKIRGRATYAEGALALAQSLADKIESLENGVYELGELRNIFHLLPGE